jgi:hypothetical protein
MIHSLVKVRISIVIITLSINLTFYLALRVEWAKAKARAARWEEEVVLLDEEMRRVIQFCDWKAEWWRNQPLQRVLDFTNNILSDGLKAFAEQQAAQEINIAEDWAAKWSAVRIRAAPIIEGMPDGYQEEGVHVGTGETIELYIEDDGYESDGQDF